MGEIIKSDWRKRVHDDARLFKQLLLEKDLQLDVDSLIPYSRWITPVQAPSRFDTRFYLSTMPEELFEMTGKDICDGEETVSSVWVSPDEAIASFCDKKILLAPPTYCILNNLCKYSNWKQLVDEQVKISSQTDVFSTYIQPSMINNKDGSIKAISGERTPKQLIVLPGDSLYSVDGIESKPVGINRLEIYGPYDYNLVQRRESKL